METVSTVPSNKVAQIAGSEGRMVGTTSGSTEGEGDVPTFGCGAAEWLNAGDTAVAGV